MSKQNGLRFFVFFSRNVEFVSKWTVQSNPKELGECFGVAKSKYFTGKEPDKIYSNKIYLGPCSRLQKCVQTVLGLLHFLYTKELLLLPCSKTCDSTTGGRKGSRAEGDVGNSSAYLQGMGISYAARWSPVLGYAPALLGWVLSHL